MDGFIKRERARSVRPATKRPHGAAHSIAAARALMQSSLFAAFPKGGEGPESGLEFDVVYDVSRSRHDAPLLFSQANGATSNFSFAMVDDHENFPHVPGPLPALVYSRGRRVAPRNPGFQTWHLCGWIERIRQNDGLETGVWGATLRPRE